jgi:restriction endonuclease S subunit
LIEKPDGLPYIGLEHVETSTGRLLLDVQPEFVESAVSAFRSGDVLFGKLRPYLAKAARPDFDGVCTTELLVLRPRPEVDRGYLFYSLLAQEFVRWINSLTYGTKMPRVSPEQVVSTAIGLPPIDEQRAIADFLDRETAKLDALLARIREGIERLSEFRTALITRGVTKGVDRKARLKQSDVAWLGEIPRHWEVRRLKYVASIRNEKLIEKPDGLPYIGLEHVETSTGRLLLDVQPEFVESAVSAFRSGDVLFGKLRPYLAKAARPDFDGVCTTELLVLRPRPEVDRGYLFYSLLAQEFVRWINSLTYGTKMPRVSPEQVVSTAIGLPPIDEQRAIADFLDRETAKLDALLARIREGIERLKEYRTALISAAVTGKIDVRDTLTASRQENVMSSETTPLT